MSLLFKHDKNRSGKPKLRTWPKVVAGTAFLSLLFFSGRGILRKHAANELLKQKIAAAYLQHGIPATQENVGLGKKFGFTPREMQILDSLGHAVKNRAGADIGTGFTIHQLNATVRAPINFKQPVPQDEKDAMGWAVAGEKIPRQQSLSRINLHLATAAENLGSDTSFQKLMFKIKNKEMRSLEWLKGWERNRAKILPKPRGNLNH